jgi:PAS domain S-box-containing protein
MSSQTSLLHGESLFRHLFDQASLGIAVEDIDGTLLLVNPALCSMLKYRESELCGMHCSQFANPEDSEDDWASFQQLRAGAINNYSLEKRYVTKDGAHIWGRLNVSLLKNGDEGPPLVFAFVEDITAQKLTEQALENVSRRLIESQEQERTRIARELHDDIGQRLALLANELQQLQQSFPDLLLEAQNRISEIQKDTFQLAADIRSLSHTLHSSKLEHLGIAAAVKGFCHEFGAQQKAEIDFKSHDVPSPLSRDISICLFRVVQEALHNSAKHSRVRHFSVELWGTSDEIHLAVSDSGVGFDRKSALNGQGLGLISMEERLKFLRGTLSIESQPNRGTTVHARVPLGAR